MTRAVLDDHLLRDLLVGDVPDELALVFVDHEPATTNLYLYRLTRSVAASHGGALTGQWAPRRRLALGARLLDLVPEIEIVPMRSLTHRMAEVAAEFHLSTLGAEGVCAAEHLGAPLCVWSGDDGPRIRAATAAIGGRYLTISR